MGELRMIYSSMSAVMNDIGAISKDQMNSFQRYRFRGIDDVMNALYPVLCKHQIVLEPQMTDSKIDSVTTKDGKMQIHALVTMRYTFYAPDGSSVSAVTLGEGLDSSDKAVNKAMAVAMKYAMFQTFCIPTEEMRAADPDNYSPQIEPSAVLCDDCGKAITPVEVSIKGGTVSMTVDNIVQKSKARYNRCLCWDCSVKAAKSKPENV